jgi:hypothetical protein
VTTSSPEAPETNDLPVEPQADAPKPSEPRNKLPLAARVILVALVIALSLGAFLAVCTMRVPFLRTSDPNRPVGYVLPDPDSNLRWRQVTQSVANLPPHRPATTGEEDAPLGWVSIDNAPFGRPNEWTTPMTHIGIAAVWATETLTGYSTPLALETTPLWLGPAIGVAIGITLLVMGWRLAGCLVGLAWMAGWPVLFHLLSATGPGMVDHRAFHCLLMILIYGGLLVARKKWQPMAATLVGAVCALGIWSGGTGFLPLLVPVLFLAAWDVIKPTEDGDTVRAFWKRWWITGLVGTALTMLLQYGPSGLLHTRLEFLSIWHVAFWAVVGVGLILLSQAKRLAIALPLIVLFGAGVLLLLAGALKGINFGDLHIMQNDEASRFMAAVGFEPAQDLKESLISGLKKFGLLPLGLLLAARMLGKLNRGERFLFLTTLFVGEMALWQGRWSLFFAPLALMTAGLMVAKLIGQSKWVWATPLVLLLATLPGWREQYIFYRVASDSQWNPVQGPREWTRALALDAIAHQVPLIPGIGRTTILAPVDMGPLLSGPVVLVKMTAPSGETRTLDATPRVIASDYWSNTQGNLAMCEMLTTTDDQRFKQLLDERRIRFILDAGPDRMRGQIGLACVGQFGWDPLDPKTRDDVLDLIPRTSFWRFLYSRKKGIVRSQLVALYRPEWRLVAVPETYDIPDVAPPMEPSLTPPQP